jgi:Protein of unknown function (DUF3501)
MNALTLDDLLPLDDYRRVRVGPGAALLFTNRQTLWFQVQDLLRIARLAEPARVQGELDLHNRLLPTRNRLQAALLLNVDETRLTEALAPWRDLRGGDLRLCLGPTQLPANLLTCRPEDQCIGTAHWVQFVVDSAARDLLADFRSPAHFALTCAHYRHESAPLSDEVRQSLLDDLELSDRDR